MPKKKINKSIKRSDIVNQCIPYDGEVWYIDAKYESKSGTMKIASVRGDISNSRPIDEGIITALEGIVAKL